MNDLDVFLTELRDLGVKLWVEGDKLKLRAPEGAMTPALTAALRERKAEILALLQPEPSHAIPPLPVADSYAVSAAQRRLWVLAQFPDASTAYNIPLHQCLEGPLDASALAAAFVRLVARHESLRTTFAVIDGEPRQVVHAHFGNAGRCRSGFSPMLAEARAEARCTKCEAQPTKCRAEARPTGELLEFRDLTGLADPDASARQLGREESAQPFDLAAGPLFRAILLKLAEDRHVLLFTIHHIIADGVSLGVLARDLSRLYESARTGVPDGLPPLRIGYPAYAAWQNQQLHSEAMATHRRFWLEQLGGELPVLNLPLDFPRPPVQTFQGRELSFLLPPERLDALNAFCRERNASLFMALHAVLKVLLHSYTGQEDIIIGCPVAGRDHADLNDQIGFYLNTLALRTRVDGAMPFEEFFGHVAAATKAAFDHRIYPFDQLLGELKLSRDPSRFPLFDVMLVLQNQDEPGLGMGGLRAGSVFEHPGTSKFDLTFTCKATPAGLVLSIEYNTDLFREERIRRMGGHFLNLIESVLADPRRAVGRLNLLGEEERRRIESLAGPEAGPFPRQTLVDWFERQAARTPEHTALIWPGGQGVDVAATQRQTLSYAELNRRANRLAHHLRRLGVRPGVAVALYLERSMDMIVAILGVLKAGGAYLPLDTGHPAERVAFTLADAAAPVLVTQGHLLDKLPETAAQRICIDSDWEAIAQESGENPPPLAGPDDIAYLIYTSGSTGRPKGVRVSHANATRLFSATEAWFQFGPDDVWTLFHSYAFDFSVWEIWGALLYGGRLVLPSYWATRSPDSFHALLAEEGVTVLNQTPSAFRQLIQWEEQAGTPPPLALRLVIFGGEALEFGSLAPWLARHGDQRPRLVNMYGITETTVHVTYRPVTAADVGETASLIGRPIPDLSLRLLDRHLRPVPIGVPGEIHVGGAGVAQGYLNRPELTAERFVSEEEALCRSDFSPTQGRTSESGRAEARPTGRLYRSGDLGRWREDGDLEYLGRVDQQVQIRGFRVELGEIEAALAALPGVRRAVVDVRGDRAGDPRLVAWYVAAGEADVPPAELREGLRAKLPDYMVPARFARVDAIPLTGNGKANRKALAEPEAEASHAACYVPPGTDWERRLARLWEDVLNVPQVGIHDNFFELGGHSLKVTAFLAALQKDSGVRLSLVDVFRQPTVAALARMAEAADPAALPALEPIRAAEADLGILPATAEELEWLNQL